MDQPTVCCVMLTKDRAEMAARAVRAFRAQTYPNKRLLIWDTGELNRDFDTTGDADGEVAHIPAQAYRDVTIGRLRNEANAFWTEYPIIIHFDDDDVSDPNRIAEQVALLQSSGAECVGYRECLFWRSNRCQIGEAWLYSVPSPSWAIGASMCYWRRVWEQRPFADLPQQPNGSSEDVVWRREVKCVGVSAATCRHPTVCSEPECEPRLVCGIHGGNTMKYDIEKYPNTWRRVPQFDDTCRRIMAL